MVELRKEMQTSLLVLGLLIMSFLASYGVTAMTGGAAIHVYPTLGGSPIQDAIDNASAGDTILVHKGTYYENVVIDKSLSLIGEDPNSTVIDGNKTGSTILIIYAGNVSVSRFTIMNSGPQIFDCGISIEYTSNAGISSNVITSNNDGISLRYSANCVLSNNTIYSNDYDGLSLYYSGNNTLANNTLYLNEMHGINLQSSSDNIISSNTLRSNENYGMNLQHSSNNKVTRNTLSLSESGIALYYCTNNTFSSNVVSSCSQGIRFHTSSYNAIIGNTITGNAIGLSLMLRSSNNTVYHNDFHNYMLDARSSLVNLWYSEGEGNSWGDYAGQDLDADGIGDVSYFLDATNEDKYPLMGTFSQHDIESQGIIYSLTTIADSSIAEIDFANQTETGDKILHFNVTGGVGAIAFCRIMIPIELMEPPYIILCDGEEIIPKTLTLSNQTHVCLYFLYASGSHAITIVSSKMMNSYKELLDRYNRLQVEFSTFNETYNNMLTDYGDLLNDRDKLQKDFAELNATYYSLLGNYSQLQEELARFSKSDQKHQLEYLEQVQNARSLGYVFAAATAILITTLICLSKNMFASSSRKVTRLKDEA